MYSILYNKSNWSLKCMHWYNQSFIVMYQYHPKKNGVSLYLSCLLSSCVCAGTETLKEAYEQAGTSCCILWNTSLPVPLCYTTYTIMDTMFWIMARDEELFWLLVVQKMNKLLMGFWAEKVHWKVKRQLFILWTNSLMHVEQHWNVI